MRITVAGLARLFMLSFLLCAPAQPQSRRKRARKPAKPPATEFIANSLDDPMEGEIEGRVYANKFFGLRLTFPEGWFVLSDVGKKAIMENGREKLKPLSPLERKVMEQSFDRTFNLLTVGQYMVAPQGQSSGSLMCMAELLPVINLTPAQYVAVMKEHVLPRSTIKYEVVGEVAAEKIGGADFSVLRLKIETPLGEAAQEYHITIRQGFALGFILTYLTEEQHNLLNEVLKSVTLDKRAAK